MTRRAYRPRWDLPAPKVHLLGRGHLVTACGLKGIETLRTTPNGEEVTCRDCQKAMQP